MGAPKGNKNAQVGEKPASANLNIRTTPDEIEAWREAAKKYGSGLSLWVRKTLNKEASKK